MSNIYYMNTLINVLLTRFCLMLPPLRFLTDPFDGAAKRGLLSAALFFYI